MTEAVDKKSANAASTAKKYPGWEVLSDTLKGFRMLAAFVIVMSYIAILIWLIYQLGNEAIIGEKNERGFSSQGWEQITHLLAAMGALVTTAAGVVIGVQVQQVSVSSANRRAERSENEAVDAKAKKEKTQSAAADAIKEIDAIAEASLLEGNPASPDTMKKIRVALQETLKP